MLLKNSISNTKKFFQKTIDNVRSFLSKETTYQKLPKTPPFHPLSCGCETNETESDARYNNNKWDYFYNEVTNQWDLSKRKTKNGAQTKKIRASMKKTQQVFLDGSFQKQNCNDFAARNAENRANLRKNSDFNEGSDVSNEKFDGRNEILKSKRFNLSLSDKVKRIDLCSRSVREKKLFVVAEKLKELEVIDKENFDHKLDFEEVLHCYLRLTCPAYLDIVDKFLMEMCGEFSSPQASVKVD